MRILFDSIIEEFPEMSYHLGIDSKILHCKEFYTTIIKVQNNEISSLSINEKNYLIPFLIKNVLKDEFNESSYAEKIKN